MENVASMSPEVRETITTTLNQEYAAMPVLFDAASVSPVSRPRYYWLSYELSSQGELYKGWKSDEKGGVQRVSVPRSTADDSVPEAQQFLDPQCRKIGTSRYPTAVRHVPREKEPPLPAGIEGCDEETLKRW